MYQYTPAISFNLAMLFYYIIVYYIPDSRRMLIGSGSGSSPRGFWYNLLYITERIQGKSILLDGKHEYLGYRPSLPSITRTRVGRRERPAPRERNHSDDVRVYRGHAVSGRPSPGHIIEATDGQVSKVTKRTGAEI
jgi:hypothetical protein